ncbi:MAG: hypothetical protein KBG29_03105 [Pseudomonadales bacterium]|nr:hypothetical protein [Pseudomonadales bacterium]
MRRAIALALVVGLGACGPRDAPVASLEVAARGAFSAALSPDGSQAAIGSLHHGGSLWDLDTRQRRFAWNHRAGAFTPITAVAFAPGGEAAMTAEHETLVLWDTASGEAITYFTAPAKVNAIALGPGGRFALLGLSDDTAVLFDARKGGIKRVFAHEGRVRSVALDADARLALSGGEDRSARLWDVETGTELQRWQHDADVRLVALAPDGLRAFSVSKYDRAVVWDTTSGLELGALPAFRARVTRGETWTAAAFSADGGQLLTGTTDRRVQLWDLPAVERRAQWEMPRRADWKRSGAYMLAVGFGAAQGACLSVSADGFVHQLRVTP